MLDIEEQYGCMLLQFHVFSNTCLHTSLHSSEERNFLHWLNVNVWCYILHNQKIHSSIFEGFRECVIYLQFLQNDLSELLEDVRLHTQLHDDGALPRFSREMKTHLDHRFTGRWIGYSVPWNWPPKSPDLNPLHIYLCGNVKHLVKKHKLETWDTYVCLISDAATNIMDNSEKLWESYAWFIDEGNNFEKLM
jgi:hypothetical protein